MEDDLASKITEVALRCEGAEMIEPPKVGEGEWKNELLLFIKPEVFLLADRANVEKTIRLVLDKLSKFDAKIDGIYALGGSMLEKNNIMSKHYGYINQISNSASKLIDAEQRAKIEEAFGLKFGSYQIMGGHEYLQKYKYDTPDTLDELWLSEKSIKIRSGLYVRHIKKGNDDIVLVNGFHPKQLSYYTERSHRIALMLIHSNTSWSRLKNEMIGTTFPEKAVPDSIRGILYREIKDYGFPVISVAINGVHLSAGPFEGMAEIVNFFGKIANLDIAVQPPLLLKMMVQASIPQMIAVKALDNPQINYNGRSTDLFTSTEDMDSQPAISVFKDTIAKA